ncbi:MAG: DUF1802 family protein [Planctomycetes bacterium]|nr:DUF1802 family protein [Planctomycetota bacterium]
MLKHAFKEWAVICRALAEGRQALILRKGGLEEIREGFQLEQTRFWFFPTYTHQQRTGIKPEALPLLEQVEKDRPPEGVVRLSHFAEVGGVYVVHQLPQALMLAGLHLWSEETVRARFAYRRPGLHVLPVRVYRAAETVELVNTREYEGCRTWVELERALPTEGAQPVLNDESFREVLRTLDAVLNPTALA